MSTTRHFITEIYKAALEIPRELNADIEQTARMLAKEGTQVGRAWCKENGYQGYTSYSSLDDLVQRASCFDELRTRPSNRTRKNSRAICRWISAARN